MESQHLCNQMNRIDEHFKELLSENECEKEEKVENKVK